MWPVIVLLALLYLFKEDFTQAKNIPMYRDHHQYIDRDDNVLLLGGSRTNNYVRSEYDTASLKMQMM